MKLPFPRRVVRSMLLLAALLGVGGPAVQAQEGAPQEDAKVSEERSPLPSDAEIAKLPPDGGPEFNRLVFESSPYLLQHCRNPVDWYPWGDEAFARAKAENKPVFLSVGYSTCYWCHVMERESFEDAEVAALLNKHYICIKVDREERPDVDNLYITATQMMLGHAGWPNNVWLTWERKPWFASTYVPKEDSEGGLGFKTLLLRLAERFESNRGEIDKMSVDLSGAIEEFNAAGKSSGLPVERDQIAKPLRALSFAFDSINGGVGQAPKFPPHGALALWLYEYRQTQDPKLLDKFGKTLDAMAKGGIRDHIGGGFHRYSTDGEWVLPHFEKMLYDNAQLARSYTDGWLLTGKSEYAQVAQETLDWALREMRDANGGFYSAIDAETDGDEGVYYTFSVDEVHSLLGPDEGAWFAEVFQFEPEGNFFEERTGLKTHKNVLHRASLEKLAEEQGSSIEALEERLGADLGKLRDYRQRRKFPHVDDKVITSWNALLISSLAYAGRHLEEPRYIKAAQRAAEFLLQSRRSDGSLAHSWRNGRMGGPAFLDDYALLMQALVELYLSTGEAHWLAEAEKLAGQIVERFGDAEPGFFYSGIDGDAALSRSKSGTDDVIPAGNGVVAQAFAQLAVITGNEQYRQLSAGTISAFSGQMDEAPLSTQSLYIALAMLSDNSKSLGALGSELRIAAGQAEAAAGPSVSSLQPPVSVILSASDAAVRPGGSLGLHLEIELSEGFHLNSHTPLQDFLLPFNVVLEEQAGFGLGQLQYPLGSELLVPGTAEPQSVYYSGTSIDGVLHVSPELAPGDYSLTFLVALQPCNERECLLPQSHRLTLEIAVDPDAGSGRPSKPRRSPEGQGGAGSATAGLVISGSVVLLAFLTAYLARRKRKRRQ